MQARDIAELVELSEAHAYASLVRPRALLSEASGASYGFLFGAAVAVVAPEVTTSLNLNRVVGLGIKEPADEATIDAIGRLYQGHELSYAIEIGPHAEPPELHGWLRLRRMRRSLPTAMRYRVAGPMRQEPGDLSVVQARDAIESALVAQICCSVFRMPAPVGALLAATQHDPRWRQWIVRRGAIPIAASLSFIDQGVAWLGWDATLPEFRGRGAHRAMIAARVHDAWEAGCGHVTTETAVHSPPDPSTLNYQRAAFLCAYERMTYVAIRRPGEPIPERA